MTDETRPFEEPETPEAVSSLPAAQPVKKRSALRETIETLLLAAIIFFAVRLVILNFRVDGNSMLPNLHNREMLLVNHQAYLHLDLGAIVNWIPGVDVGDHEVYPFNPPQRGDIIVFNPPNDDKPYIKRIIGLPGDTIAFADGYVILNGQRLDEPYIQAGITRCPTRQCEQPVTIGPGQVYVLGDNRGNSEDSRYFGPIQISSIIGKAWVTYWPLDDFGRVPHYGYKATASASAAATPSP